MSTKQPGVWGIDLGQCALKAVRLEEIEGKMTATNFDFVEHPKILSQPDADPDELARQALEKFLERNDIKGDTVAISVPGQSGLARFVKLPPVEQKKVAEIVKFEAKQQIPFPLEEVVWDFQKIGRGVVSDGYAMETEIGLFAMKRDMVSRALQQFSDVNVEVHIVQMAPLALVNYVTFDILKRDLSTDGEPSDEEDKPAQKNCIVALDIGADTSNLVITDGERVIWQRPIPVGGNRFTRDLTRELKLTFAKAEHIKCNAARSPDLRKILLALRPGLNEFVNEVQRSLGYFMNTHRNTKIKQMIGLGNAFRLPGLQKFLQEKLQLEVIKLGQTFRIKGDDVVGKPLFKENILTFGIAFGLALQGLQKTRIHTNLLPQEIRSERLIRAKKPWAVAAAAVLLLGTAFLVFGQSVLWGRYNQKENKDLKTAFGNSKKVKDHATSNRDKYNEKEEEVKKSIATVNRISSGAAQRFNWPLVNKFVIDCLPRPNPANPNIAFQDKSIVVRSKYVTGNARPAYNKWLELLKRSPEDEVDLKKDLETIYFIKKNMSRINIEGINCLYTDNLANVLDKVRQNMKKELHPFLPVKLKDDLLQKKNLPQAGGWVFEIRGFTYWYPVDKGKAGFLDPKWFVNHTLVLNLRHPTNKGTDIELTEEMAERIKKNMSFVMMYKAVEVPDPTADQLTLANKSHLPDLVGGGGKAGPAGGAVPPGTGGTSPGPESGQGGAETEKKDGGSGRDGWTPKGEIAKTVLGGAATTTNLGGMPEGGKGGEAGTEQGTEPAAGGNLKLPPRTEFIILFLWQEPTLEKSTGEGQTPTPAPAG